MTIISKIINNQQEIKRKQFTEENFTQYWKIKSRKAADIDKLSKVWKTRKFDDLLLQLYSKVYNEKQ